MSPRRREILLLPLVVAISLAAGCASRGARPVPFPRPSADRHAAASGHPAAAEIVRTALAVRGAPYRFGGEDPSGFDCSGLVAYVFRQHGVSVPRTVAGQYAFGRRVSPRSLLPGDLVFFSTSAPGPSHVGIAISSDSFVHAPSAPGTVRIEDLRSGYWKARLVGARRPGTD